jgi:uncharacterized membrane protein YhaH (DUF805 family)
MKARVLKEPMSFSVWDLMIVPIVMGLGTLKISWYLRRPRYEGSWYQRHVQLLGILTSLAVTIACVIEVHDLKRSGIVFILAIFSFWGTRWIIRDDNAP